MEGQQLPPEVLQALSGGQGQQQTLTQGEQVARQAHDALMQCAQTVDQLGQQFPAFQERAQQIVQSLTDGMMDILSQIDQAGSQQQQPQML